MAVPVILEGDCLEVMPTLEAESVDAVVTDPPYGLEFMGKEWDRLGDAGFHAPKDEGRTFTNASGHMFDNLKSLPRYGKPLQMQAWHERWAREAFRLAKPSAYLLAFGGTRTVHRMTCAIEDAGWIVRDMLVWAYASGFPKSKASLKPAWEPIVLARKPGPLRELAIDACRIPGVPPSVPQPDFRSVNGRATHLDANARNGEMSEALGRWPANVILTDPIFDGGWDGVVGGGEAGGNAPASGPTWTGPSGSASRSPMAGMGDREPHFYGDSGTYSRFFLIPKADRAEREPIWGHDLDERPAGWRYESRMPKGQASRANVHPTVKPLELMRHLVRLVTPTDGLVLDPCLGSGTTGIAAEMEGFRWIGIEREPEYVRIAEARLHGTQRGLGLPA